MISLLARKRRGSRPEASAATPGIDLHRPFAAARDAAGHDLLEPPRLDERQVLQQPGQVGARFHGAAPGVRFTEAGELLDESGPLAIERAQELLDFRSHGRKRNGVTELAID